MRGSILPNPDQPVDQRARDRSTQRTPSCRVVPYAPEHKAAVADLQRHLWSPDTRLNASYLEWKYHRNPYVREPLIYLAFEGARLVGMRGVCGTRWEVGNPAELVTLPCADDLVVDPAHRGQGIHRIIMTHALRDLAERGYRFVINLSASFITSEASLNMQWRNAGRVQATYRRTSRKALVDHLASRARHTPLLWRWADRMYALAGRSGGRLFSRLDARLSLGDRVQDAESIYAQATPPALEMSRLVARLPNDGRFRHLRDASYFAWRFENPLRNYRFVCSGREHLRGYLVLQQSPTVDATRVHIVDCEAESDLVRAELISAAIAHGGFPEICFWQLGASAELARLIERLGFVPTRGPHEHSILVRSVRDEELTSPWTLGGRQLDDASQWDLRMLYSMLG